MSNNQQDGFHFSVSCDQKASEALFKISNNLEQDTFLAQTKVVDQTLNFLTRWSLMKSPHQALKNITKKNSKIDKEDTPIDSAKRRTKRLRDNDKIDFALDVTACVDPSSSQYCSETGFYVKYKNLVRSLASQKWRAWTAGVAPITRGQLRAKMSGSAKAGSLQKINREQTSSSDSVLKEPTDEDLIYPSKLQDTTPNSEAHHPKVPATQKRLTLEIHPTETKEKKLALRNQRLFAQKSTRGQLNRHTTQYFKNRPSIPNKNNHTSHSFDCCGRSFATMPPTFPPIAASNLKHRNVFKK